ncbi:MAG: hypothetical protein ACLFS3_03215 [Candidatus Aenigmatarchaeota archaeon]
MIYENEEDARKDLKNMTEEGLIGLSLIKVDEDGYIEAVVEAQGRASYTLYRQGSQWNWIEYYNIEDSGIKDRLEASGFRKDGEDYSDVVGIMRKISTIGDRHYRKNEVGKLKKDFENWIEEREDMEVKTIKDEEEEFSTDFLLD